MVVVGRDPRKRNRRLANSDKDHTPHY